VLAEIGAGDIPQIQVFNKIDRLEGAQPRRERTEAGAGERVFVSARDQLGLDLLKSAISERFALARCIARLVLGPADGRLRARLFALAAVRSEHADEEGWTLEIDLPLAQAARLSAEFPSFAAQLGDVLASPVEEWEQPDSAEPSP
jgi:GTP-binding protein HflX